MQPPDEKTNDFVPEQHPLILVGASVRAAAQSAIRAGFAVTGVDFFGDTDTRRICQNFVLLNDSSISLLRQLHRDPSVPLLTVGGCEQHDQICQTLGRLYRRCGPTEQQVRAVRSLAFLRQIAQDTAGVQLPVTRPSTLGSLPAKDNNVRWLSKRINGSGGLGVQWAHPDDGTPAADSYQQAWVPGRAYGAVCLSDGQSTSLLGVCRSRTKRLETGRRDDTERRSLRPFVYAGSSGPIMLPARIWAAIEQLAAAVVQSSGISGLFNIDLLIAGPEIWLLEINPRWSASCELIELALNDQQQLPTGDSLIGWSMQLGQDTDRPPTSLPTTNTGAATDCYDKRIVYSPRSGRFNSLALAGLGTGTENRVLVADIPADQQSISRGEPIATLIQRWPQGQPSDWKKTKRLIAQVQSAVEASI